MAKHIEPKPKEVVKEGKLNELIIKEYKRSDGSVAVEYDFEFCPSMAEQHTAHLTDLNYLMEKFQPDELAAYIAARSEYRREIIGHDFTLEPSLQDTKNIIYNMRKAFDELDSDIKVHFKNHVEFMKFIDNPANQEKMIKMGLLEPKQIQQLTQTETAPNVEQTTTRTKDAKD